MGTTSIPVPLSAVVWLLAWFIVVCHLWSLSAGAFRPRCHGDLPRRL